MSANRNNTESNQLWKVHGLVSKFVILRGLEKNNDRYDSKYCLKLMQRESTIKFAIKKANNNGKKLKFHNVL